VRPTSQAGKTKRERFARSRSGITLPISMHLSRLKFREAKTSASGISQSLDGGDNSSEMNDSFEEGRSVKRTSSAPSREDSCTPPMPTPSESSSGPPTATGTGPNPLPIIRDTIPEIRYPSPCTSGEMEVPHVTVQVETSPKHSNEDLTKLRDTSSGAKLQGVIQPLRTSSPHSGWL
jgi:hypothetical protein